MTNAATALRLDDAIASGNEKLAISIVDRLAQWMYSNQAQKSDLPEAEVKKLTSQRLYWDELEEIHPASGTTILLAAASFGFGTLCALLLEKFTINCAHHNSNGQTALHLASKFGSLPAVQALLAFGGAEIINIADKNGDQAIHVAQRSGHDALVAAMITAGATPTARTDGGDYLIHLAAAHSSDVANFKDLWKEYDENDRAVKNDRGWNVAHFAASSNNHPVLEYLLKSGIDQDAPDIEGYTPLHIACFRGHGPAAAILLAANAALQARNHHGQTPLHCAAHIGSERVIKQLLKHNADVAEVDHDGWTALHVASAGGHHQICALLLLAGAKVDARAFNGDTPLHFAVCRAPQGQTQEDTMKELLEWKADINLDTGEGFTALSLAVASGQIRATRLLLRRGANANIEDDRRRTPLQAAANLGDPEIVRALIQHGAKISHRDADGGTPALDALIAGKLNALDALLEAGADADSPDAEGNCLLHVAIMTNHCHLVKVLLQHRANMNAAARDGSTPLHVAATFSRGDAVKDLLEAKANHHIRNHAGHTPLHLALLHKSTDIAEQFLQARALVNTQAKDGTSPLHAAVVQGLRVSSLRLLECGADVECADKEMWTPLHCVAVTGDDVVAEALLQRGSSPRWKTKAGTTPLHLAAMLGHLTLVTKFLAAGGEPTAQDGTGVTAVHLAAREGHTLILEKLFQVGAPVAPRSYEGATPMHFASAFGRTAIIEQLIQHGGNPEEKDEGGRVPMMVAAAKGQSNVIPVLLKHGATVHIMDKRKRTALHMACVNNHVGTAAMLTKRGAIIDHLSSDGYRPLDNVNNPALIRAVHEAHHARQAMFGVKGEVTADMQRAAVFMDKYFHQLARQLERQDKPTSLVFPRGITLHAAASLTRVFNELLPLYPSVRTLQFNDCLFNKSFFVRLLSSVLNPFTTISSVEFIYSLDDADNVSVWTAFSLPSTESVSSPPLSSKGASLVPRLELPPLSPSVTAVTVSPRLLATQRTIASHQQRQQEQQALTPSAPASARSGTPRLATTTPRLYGLSSRATFILTRMEKEHAKKKAQEEAERGFGHSLLLSPKPPLIQTKITSPPSPVHQALSAANLSPRLSVSAPTLSSPRSAARLGTAKMSQLSVTSPRLGGKPQTTAPTVTSQQLLTALTGKAAKSPAISKPETPIPHADDRKVTIVRGPEIAKYVIQCLPQTLPQVQCITLDGCMPEQMLGVLARTLPESKLRRMRLRHNHFTASAADSICIMMNYLEELNVSHNQLGDAGAAVIAEYLPTRATPFLLLDLGHNSISDAGARKLASVLAGFPEMSLFPSPAIVSRSAYSSRSGSPAHTPNFAPTPAPSPFERSPAFDAVHPFDGTTETLMPPLQLSVSDADAAPVCLWGLCLNGNRMRDLTASVMLRAASVGRVRTLRVSDVGLSVAITQPLCNALMAARELTDLDLSANHLDDLCVKEVKEALLGNLTITTLNLEGNKSHTHRGLVQPDLGHLKLIQLHVERNKGRRID
eukprot:TRINITY_DN4487_c0_g1_i1.p1 TRINITY_DN4487_c0_g1~~TRINITY_DN4487_c0_g1_i1.p1  ORF type:complete len:1504 (+),score=400.78 TRINITY_DN4487_c0_g1_i1:58-4569(+)